MTRSVYLGTISLNKSPAPILGSLILLMGDLLTTHKTPKSDTRPRPDAPERPTDVNNDEERKAQIDDILTRFERLEVEAARLRQLAARLQAAREWRDGDVEDM